MSLYQICRYILLRLQNRYEYVCTLYVHILTPTPILIFTLQSVPPLTYLPNNNTFTASGSKKPIIHLTSESLACLFNFVKFSQTSSSWQIGKHLGANVFIVALSACVFLFIYGQICVESQNMNMHVPSNIILLFY